MSKHSKPGLNRFGEALDTRRQLHLYAAANKLLAKAGYFAPKEKREQVPVEAAQIGQNSRLRPTWQGRA